MSDLVATDTRHKAMGHRWMQSVITLLCYTFVIEGLLYMQFTATLVDFKK